MGGIISITHYGIKEVEDAKASPAQPTHHFPAVNVINVGSMVNSAIQQASPDALQTIQPGDSRSGEIIEVLNQVRSALDNLGLRPSDVDYVHTVSNSTVMAT